MTPAERLRRIVANEIAAASDNHERARGEFEGLSATEMQALYGASGRSKQSIVDMYSDDLALAHGVRDLVQRLLGPQR